MAPWTEGGAHQPPGPWEMPVFILQPGKGLLGQYSLFAFFSDPSTQVPSSSVVSETQGIVLKDDQRKRGQTCQDPVMCHTQVTTHLSGLKNK